MTIEIRNRELEVLLQQRLEAGNFASIEEMLLSTLREREFPCAEVFEEPRRERAFAAAVRIRELRKGVTLDRPEGMSLRDYAHIGHRY